MSPEVKRISPHSPHPTKGQKCGVIPNMDVQRHGALAVPMYDCNGCP